MPNKIQYTSDTANVAPRMTIILLRSSPQLSRNKQPLPMTSNCSLATHAFSSISDSNQFATWIGRTLALEVDFMIRSGYAMNGPSYNRNTNNSLNRKSRETATIGLKLTMAIVISDFVLAARSNDSVADSVVCVGFTRYTPGNSIGYAEKTFLAFLSRILNLSDIGILIVPLRMSISVVNFIMNPNGV